ncbi:hypothetical protein ES705_05106 [subsurface metagenome]
MKKKKLILTSLIFGLLLMVISGCKKDVPLTPARNLVGTWKTSTPAKFTYKTDFCDFVNIMDVGTADWDVTWVIKENPNDENKVDITMTFTTSNFQPIATNCGFDNGYVPQVSPINNLEATISSSSIAILDLSSGSTYTFNGSFTNNNITGKWDSYYEGLYYSGEYTLPNGLILNKQ